MIQLKRKCSKLVGGFNVKVLKLTGQVKERKNIKQSREIENTMGVAENIVFMRI